MNFLPTKTPEGTRDWLFEECRAHDRVRAMLTGHFETHGYSGVITPTLEYYELFSDSGLDETSVYKLTGIDNRLLALRPDNTTPIARLMASRLRDRALPIRLHYSQNVFTVHSRYSGHSNEISQSGVELIGPDGLLADLEVIHLALSALRLFEKSFTLELGHAGIFQAIAAGLNTDGETLEAIRLCIESKNLAALDELLDALPPSAEVEAIRALPTLYGGGEVLTKAANLLGPCAGEVLDTLRQVYEAVHILAKACGGRVNLDLGLVHRNDYYTGTVFRGYIGGSGETALLGGRYNNLLSRFGRPLPATGFSTYNSALIALLLRTDNDHTVPVDTLVLAAPGYEAEALLEQSRCVAAGERCIIDRLTDPASQLAACGATKARIVAEQIIEREAIL